MQRRTSYPVWYTLVACFLSAIVTGLFAFLMGVRAIEINNRKWCSLVVTLDDSHLQNEKLAAAVKGLRDDFGC